MDNQKINNQETEKTIDSEKDLTDCSNTECTDEVLEEVSGGVLPMFLIE